MAKGDVVMKFDGETADFVQKMAKMREEMLRTANATRDLQEKTVSAGDKLKDYFGGLASGLGLVIPSAVEASVKAIHLLAEVGTKVIEEHEKRAEEFIARSRDLRQSLAAAGQAGSMGDVRAAIGAMAQEKIYGKQFSEAQVTSAFTGVSNASGAKASVAEKLAATHAALEAQRTGMDETAAGGVGSNLARMLGARDRGEGFAGMGDEELKDYAYRLQVYNPHMGDADWRFFGRSKDKGQAARLLFASGQSDENARAMLSLQEKAGDPERLMQMLEHPELAPVHMRAQLENLKRGMDNAPALSLSGQVKAMDQSDAANQVLGAQSQITSFKQQTAEETESEDAKAVTVRDLRQQIYERQHPYGKYFPLSRTFSRWEESDVESVYRGLHPEAVDRSGGPASGHQLTSEKSIEVLRAMLDTLNDMNRKVEGNPTLSNNKEGQK